MDEIYGDGLDAELLEVRETSQRAGSMWVVAFCYFARHGSGDEGLEYGDASAKKMVIMGALTLYLDFINLVLMLLRLFGSRK